MLAQVIGIPESGPFAASLTEMSWSRHLTNCHAQRTRRPCCVWSDRFVEPYPWARADAREASATVHLRPELCRPVCRRPVMSRPRAVTVAVRPARVGSVDFFGFARLGSGVGRYRLDR